MPHRGKWRWISNMRNLHLQIIFSSAFYCSKSLTDTSRRQQTETYLCFLSDALFPLWFYKLKIDSWSSSDDAICRGWIQSRSYWGRVNLKFCVDDGEGGGRWKINIYNKKITKKILIKETLKFKQTLKLSSHKFWGG